MSLRPNVAFYVQASLIIMFLAGSSAATPLYAVYQQQWGFSPVIVTVIFGVYAVAVLAALLVVGSLSDYVGRKPVLLVATLVQAATMGLFVTAHGVSALLIARVVQGLATGLAAGAVGAGMMDIDRTRGALANSIVPGLGTAVGAVMSGLMVQYLPAPTQLIYLTLGAVFLVQAALVVMMPETVTRRAGALASLRPQLRLPLPLREPMLLVVPALVAAWALVGFYGALGPMLVRQVVGSGSHLLGGVALFLFAASGASTVFATRLRAPRSTLVYGTAALIAGVAVTLLGVATASLSIFMLGTALSGSGFGASFQGAIRNVLPLAGPHERAGVLSMLYIVSYLAMGVPARLRRPSRRLWRRSHQHRARVRHHGDGLRLRSRWPARCGAGPRPRRHRRRI